MDFFTLQAVYKLKNKKNLRVKMIRLSKSSISDLEKQAVMRVLDSEYLGMGSEVGDFETELTNYFQCPVVCVGSGTAALHLALEALELPYERREVLVPTITYVASFQAIVAAGLLPVPCNVSEHNLCIDSSKLEGEITEKTGAIMPVHYAGGPFDIDEIYRLADKYCLRVVEDAAHAFGSIFKAKRIGSFGDVSCFSFDGIKNITSGEGGCIVTNDTQILERARDARLLGVERDSEKRIKKKRSWDFDVKRVGYRYHMSDLMAAIGREQLKRSSTFFEKRRFLAKSYQKKFETFRGLRSLDLNYDLVVPHIYPVVLDHYVDRKELMAHLSEIGIQTGIHYPCNHLLSLFETSQAKRERLFPSELLSSRILTLPLHTDLLEKDILYIVEALQGYLDDTT